MMPMNLSTNDKQVLMNLFVETALNKETIYRETKRVHDNLNNIDVIIDKLLSQHDMICSNNEETRMIFRYLDDHQKIREEQMRVENEWAKEEKAFRNSGF